MKWVERYGDYLVAYAYARLRKEELAEDLVQETFLSAWNARESFKNNAAEKTWLTSILKNKIVDHYRKASTRNELHIGGQKETDNFLTHFFETESANYGHWTNTSVPHEWNKDLSSPLERAEFSKILNICLGKLPERTRAVFVMKLIDGEEAETICKVLDITASNYWVLMHRAKLQLRECMEKNWALV